MPRSCEDQVDELTFEIEEELLNQPTRIHCPFCKTAPDVMPHIQRDLDAGKDMTGRKLNHSYNGRLHVIQVVPDGVVPIENRPWWGRKKDGGTEG